MPLALNASCLVAAAGATWRQAFVAREWSWFIACSTALTLASVALSLSLIWKRNSPQ